MSRRPGARRVPAALVGLALVTATACAADPGAEVITAPAAAALIQIAPGGTGPVQAGVDHAVVVERRATVTTVAVTEGAQVRQGQELLSVFTIGDSSAIATATNLLREHEKELESVRARDGVGATTTIAMLGQIARDRQTLTDLKSAPLVVSAPAEGRVSGLSVQAGREITRTDVVLHVIDDRILRLTVPVPAAYRDLLAAGQPAVLTLPGGSGATFNAAVVAVGPTTLAGTVAAGLTAQSETVPVVVELPNPGGIALGRAAYVRFPVDRPAAVAVNSLAVLGSGQEPFVFVVADSRIEQRTVVTGASDGDTTEILAGLAAGDEVVISGGHQLATGDSIRATRWDAS